MARARVSARPDEGGAAAGVVLFASLSSTCFNCAPFCISDSNPERDPPDEIGGGGGGAGADGEYEEGA